MKTLEKNPTNNLRNAPARLLNPWNRFFRNDFLDLWDGDTHAETLPSINITEEKDRYKVEVAAPGLKKEDFNIAVEGNLVSVSCEKESDTREGENGKGNNSYTRREYNYSCFTRSFTVPDHADTDRIAAKYNDGILSLSIPKKPEAQKSPSRKISVQ